MGVVIFIRMGGVNINKHMYQIIILLLLIALIALLFAFCHKSSDKPPATTEQTQNPLEFEEYQDYKNQSISIPGMNGIYLKANQTKQTVDFFNPEENQCYFIISLYLSDGTLIYKSDYIEPGERITDIELLQTLKKGIYKNCTLNYDCFTLNDNKSRLNGSTVKLEINSQ